MQHDQFNPQEDESYGAPFQFADLLIVIFGALCIVGIVIGILTGGLD